MYTLSLCCHYFLFGMCSFWYVPFLECYRSISEGQIYSTIYLWLWMMTSTQGLIFGNENFGFSLMSKIRLRLFTVLYFFLAEKKLVWGNVNWFDFKTYLFWHKETQKVSWFCCLKHPIVKNAGSVILFLQGQRTADSSRSF